MKITDFSRNIGYSRRTVYEMFNKKSLDIELLQKISQVLDVDLIEYFKGNDVQYSSHNEKLNKTLFLSSYENNYTNRYEIDKIMKKLDKIEDEISEIRILLRRLQ
ncbi:MAG: helix-turn-helix domain-containing protein [Bacteroidales bacterium]